MEVVQISGRRRRRRRCRVVDVGEHPLREVLQPPDRFEGSGSAGVGAGRRPPSHERRRGHRAREPRLHEGELEVSAGQGVLVTAGEWVRYSTPEGAEYVAVCLPAFDLESAHRDD